MTAASVHLPAALKFSMRARHRKRCAARFVHENSLARAIVICSAND
jgi:hypothetical protein